MSTLDSNKQSIASVAAVNASGQPAVAAVSPGEEQKTWWQLEEVRLLDYDQ